jgi:hypothetical protein
LKTVVFSVQFEKLCCFLQSSDGRPRAYKVVDLVDTELDMPDWVFTFQQVLAYEGFDILEVDEELQRLSVKQVMML